VRVVYSCFRGLYGDNPRAIYEGAAARGVEATTTWLCNERTEGTFPAGVETVRYPSPEARAALESADVVVANDCISMDWAKRPGTTYLQTWHGTPLKRIHHDIPSPRAGWLDAPDRDVARWDHLLSPNRPSTERLAHAFRFRGPVHETGYPRNDALSGPDRDAIRARMRAHLGIDEGTTAVLYAPTWRDDLVFGHPREQDFELPVDLADFTDRLGADHVLLIRLHSMVTDRPHVPAGIPVVDVTDVVDSAALYLAADVLVTDYSSAMFDFAITGRPQLFFTYDLDHYRNDLRGFYVDLAEVAPGPMVATSKELVDALLGLETVATEYADRYARFRQDFCSLEDGHATERVLDLLFPSGGSTAGPAISERG
jgi:CDP-glycerol glycerophosphotransferase